MRPFEQAHLSDEDVTELFKQATIMPNVIIYYFNTIDLNDCPDVPKLGKSFHVRDLRSWNGESFDWSDGRCYFVGCPFTSYSHYHGTTVEMANYKWFEENHNDHCYWITCAIGSNSVGLPIEVIMEEQEDEEEWITELREIFNALHEYPSIDDECVSLLEMEHQGDAWTDWACEEFWGHFVSRNKNLYCDEEQTDFEKRRLALFNITCARINEYWSHDSISAYIDTAKIANKVSARDLDESGLEGVYNTGYTQAYACEF